MIQSYIGLGSNLNEPKQQVSQALLELTELPDSQLIAQSSLYTSPPVGPQDQPDFINAVAVIKTNLSHWDLLRYLQALEQMHQRQHLERWGPRTLDLDILFYGDMELGARQLTLPHPEIHNRAFVLLPLQELQQGDTDTQLQPLTVKGQSIDYWLEQTGDQGVTQL